MKVAVFGYTDKRVVLMSLLKVFQAKGEVLLMTSDKHFQRLVDNCESIGSYQNSIIAVTNLAPEEILADLGYVENDFEHLIYDCTDELPEDVDKQVYVLSDNMNDIDRELFLSLEDCVPIYQSYGKKPRKPGFSKSVTKKETIRRKSINLRTGDIGEEDVTHKVENIVEIPVQKQMTTLNTFMFKAEYYATIDYVGCYQTAPIFKSKDLAIAIHGLIGHDLHMSVESIAAILSQGGESSVRK